MFARHGRALTGASPEHAQIVGKCIAEQQARPAKICQVESQKLFKVFWGMKNRLPE